MDAVAVVHHCEVTDTFGIGFRHGLTYYICHGASSSGNETGLTDGRRVGDGHSDLPDESISVREGCRSSNIGYAPGVSKDVARISSLALFRRKLGTVFYQATCMSFTDLKFAIESDEKEYQCP
jgi:hypothetical protein